MELGLGAGIIIITCWLEVALYFIATSKGYGIGDSF
jgi:hypothetical protein